MNIRKNSVKKMDMRCTQISYVLQYITSNYFAKQCLQFNQNNEKMGKGGQQYTNIKMYFVSILTANRSMNLHG